MTQITEEKLDVARRELLLGHLNFVVHAAVHHSNYTTFLVSTEFETRRKPGFVARTLSTGGKATKFGEAIHHHLQSIGVEASLNNVNRQMIEVDVPTDMMAGEWSVRHQLMGMPTEVAVAIQAVTNRF